MMYSSWDIEHDGQNFLSFWTIFCPFTPLTTQKIKILKNWKKHLEISSFYTSVPKIMIICYTVPEIWHVTNVIVIFILGYFLPFLLAQKMKISKKWKQETLHIVTIAMTCCSLASPWKFQYFQRHICNSVKHPWWSFYCKNSKPLIVFTKKLHHRCSLGF